MADRRVHYVKSGDKTLCCGRRIHTLRDDEFTTNVESKVNCAGQLWLRKA